MIMIVEGHHDPDVRRDHHVLCPLSLSKFGLLSSSFRPHVSLSLVSDRSSFAHLLFPSSSFQPHVSHSFVFIFPTVHLSLTSLSKFGTPSSSFQPHVSPSFVFIFPTVHLSLTFSFQVRFTKFVISTTRKSLFRVYISDQSSFASLSSLNMAPTQQSNAPPVLSSRFSRQTGRPSTTTVKPPQPAPETSADMLDLSFVAEPPTKKCRAEPLDPVDDWCGSVDDGGVDNSGTSSTVNERRTGQVSYQAIFFL
jgi:hypothetical protein